MSRLRITGGVARGRMLDGVVGKNVRPTSSRVREAWFSIVGQDLSGVSFLDAFSGSGIMALEAWSRGADVTAVERDARTIATLRARADQLGASVAIMRGDLRKVAIRLEPHALVFADPPYADAPEPWLNTLEPVTAGDLWFETDAKTSVPRCVGALRLCRTRPFGGTLLHHYERS